MGSVGQPNILPGSELMGTLAGVMTWVAECATCGAEKFRVGFADQKLVLQCVTCRWIQAISDG